jgi:hypothetical protein
MAHGTSTQGSLKLYTIKTKVHVWCIPKKGARDTGHAARGQGDKETPRGKKQEAGSKSKLGEAIFFSIFFFFFFVDCRALGF